MITSASVAAVDGLGEIEGLANEVLSTEHLAVFCDALDGGAAS